MVLPKSKRMELIFWSALPALIAVVFALICLLPKHVQGLQQFMPILPLIPVFYWGLHASDMRYPFVFLLGLFMDATMGLPLGFSSLLYLVFLVTVHVQRKYIQKEGFMIHWGYFAMFMGGFCIGGWLLASLWFSHMQPLSAAVMQWLLTVCCYPLFHQFFYHIQQYMNHRRIQILHGL